MPITGIIQPEVIPIDDALRLKKFETIPEEAFLWYQDVELVYLVDGVKRPYSRETLENMYGYLNKHGELYIIEALENGGFKPIGDVSFWQEDMPIVIGDPHYRSKGLGRKVIAVLVNRGRELGWESLGVEQIYHYNVASRKCFESQGFRICETTETGNRFVLKLT